MMESKAARRLELKKITHELEQIVESKGWRQRHTPTEVATMRKAIQLLYDYKELCGEEE